MDTTWATGTYDMLLEKDVDGAELSITIFAKPLNSDNDVNQDVDIPILAQLDLTYLELGITAAPAGWQMGLRDIGETGLVPEEAERVFGPKMGLRVLLALVQAADRDFRGIDMDSVRWREPSVAAFPLLERAHDIMVMLKVRIYDL